MLRIKIDKRESQVAPAEEAGWTSKVYKLHLVHQGFVSTVHSSDILIVLKNTCLKSCERIYTIDFSLFLKINSLDMFA